MYIHRGKNRRNKRGNESVHFFGARKDDSDNRLNDEVINYIVLLCIYIIITLYA